MSEFKIVIGTDGYKYLNAVLTGDDKTANEILAKFEKDRKERQVREWKDMSSRMSADDFEVFKLIDSTYKRKTHWWSFCGERYNCGWDLDFKLPIEDYEYSPFSVELTYRNNKYKVSIEWYGDYDQGSENVIEDCLPVNIVNEIEKLKNSSHDKNQ